LILGGRIYDVELTDYWNTAIWGSRRAKYCGTYLFTYLGYGVSHCTCRDLGAGSADIASGTQLAST